VHEECIAKMRLMSLVDLSSDGSGQIPYELIRDTLQVNLNLLCIFCFLHFTYHNSNIATPFQINDDEVELWVFKAITAKLIDCKMDQMNQVVVVRYVVPQLMAFLLAIGHVDMWTCTYCCNYFS
jgi:translation initiation factor 3 subunit M